MVARTPSTPHGDKTAVCNKVFSRWLAQGSETKRARLRHCGPGVLLPDNVAGVLRYSFNVCLTMK